MEGHGANGSPTSCRPAPPPTICTSHSSLWGQVSSFRWTPAFLQCGLAPKTLAHSVLVTMMAPGSCGCCGPPRSCSLQGTLTHPGPGSCHATLSSGALTTATLFQERRLPGAQSHPAGGTHQAPLSTPAARAHVTQGFVPLPPQQPPRSLCPIPACTSFCTQSRAWSLTGKRLGPIQRGPKTAGPSRPHTSSQRWGRPGCGNGAQVSWGWRQQLARALGRGGP